MFTLFAVRKYIYDFNYIFDYTHHSSKTTDLFYSHEFCTDIEYNVFIVVRTDLRT